MVIEVCDDVIKQVVDNKSNKVNPAAQILQELSISVIRGRHIVFIPFFTNIKEDVKRIIDSLVEILGERVVNLLLSFRNHRFDLKRILDNCNTRLIVTYRTDYTADIQFPILVNPSQMRSFEFFEETHLLTENILDSSFFFFLFKYYCKKHDLKDCRACYYPIMGGGATSAKVLKYEIDRRQHLCLSIVDSDKHYPDAEVGRTLADLLTIVEENTPFNCRVYGMNMLCEIENLIPVKILRKHPEYKLTFDVVFNYLSFYDLKSGITVRSMWDDKTREYWQKSLPSYSFALVNEMKTKYPEKCNFDSEAKKLTKTDSVIVPICWGGKLLENTIEKFGNDLNTVEEEDLNESQKIEWENIGKVIMNWTCAFNPVRV